MRAAADNQEGLLTPGMFVNVEFPSVARTDVLQIPITAVQEHEEKSFVFVHKGGDTFERRDVSLGLQNSQSAEVTAGLKPGEVIAIGGVFERGGTTRKQMLTPHQMIAVIRSALLFWQEEIAIHEPGVGYFYWRDQPYDPLSPDEVAELRRHLRFVKYVRVDPDTVSLAAADLLSAAELAASAIPPRMVAIVVLPLN